MERLLGVEPLAGERLVLERLQVVARVRVPADRVDVAVRRDDDRALPVDERGERPHLVPAHAPVVGVVDEGAAEVEQAPALRRRQVVLAAIAGPLDDAPGGRAAAVVGRRRLLAVVGRRVHDERRRAIDRDDLRLERRRGQRARRAGDSGRGRRERGERDEGSMEHRMTSIHRTSATQSLWC